MDDMLARYTSAICDLDEKVREIAVLNDIISKLVSEKTQWETEKATQQAIVQQALAQSNAREQAMGEEIQRLRALLRE